MDFYHIQILNNDRPEWKTGDEITISDLELNYFSRLLINGLGDRKHLDSGETVGFLKYIDSFLFNHLDNNYSDNELSYKYSYLEMTFCSLRDSFRQYLKWIQEDIFERIRKDKYPSLPSRLNCIWVCSYDQLINWWDLFGKLDNRFKVTPKKILKLELDGKFHKADGSLIQADTFSISEIEERAKVYWSGEIKSDTEVELLFMGNVKVLDEYENVDMINEPNLNSK